MTDRKRTQKSQNESRPNYVIIIEKLKSLRADTLGTIWQRINLGRELFRDEQWRDKLRQGSADGLIDDMQVAEEMDRHFYADLVKLGFTFLQLVEIQECFPERAQWENTESLSHLRQATYDARRANEKQPKIVRRCATVAERDQLKQKLTEAKSIAVELKKELHLGKTAFDRLVEENRTLREKYETLKRDYERLEAENEELRAALCEPVTCHL